MQMLGVGKKELTALIVAFLLLAGIYAYFGNIETTSFWAVIVAGLILSVYLVLEKTFSFYLLLVCLIPLSIDFAIAGDAQVNGPSEIMLLLLITVLILFHENYRTTVGKMLSHPIAILLVLDILWQLIVTLTSTHVDVSLKRWVIHTVFIIGFVTTITMLNDPRKVLKVWMAYVIGLLPVMLVTFRNFALYDFDPRSVFSISKPFFPDHTVYGACIAFVIPLLLILCFKWKKLNWRNWQLFGLFTLTFIAIISEFVALSRAAILSLVIAGIFALLLRWKIQFRSLMLGLIGLVIVAFSLQAQIFEMIEENDAVSNDGEVTNHLSSVTNIQNDASNLERVNRWVCAIRMFEDKPLLGYGPGTYQFEYNKFQTIEFKTYISSNSGDKGNAHSEYLTYLSEKGLVGGLIFLFIVFGAIYFGMKNHTRLEDPMLRILNLGVLLGLITYFFHGIFNSFMDQSKMAFLYFSALGVIVWLNQLQREKS